VESDPFIRFITRKRDIVILLTGREKHTQSTDIKTALRLARNL
jgi:putative component of toxin-antitoxin plasmid stabilization module